MTSCIKNLNDSCCIRFNDYDSNHEGGQLPDSFCGAKQRDRVVYPRGSNNRIWQGLMAAVAFIGTGIATAQASFTTDSTFLWVVIYLFDVMFIMDISLNFYLAYFTANGILVTDRRKIVMRYLRGPFVLDLLCVIPLDFLAFAIQSQSMARSLAFLRLNRVIKIYKCFVYFCK